MFDAFCVLWRLFFFLFFFFFKKCGFFFDFLFFLPFFLVVVSLSLSSPAALRIANECSSGEAILQVGAKLTSLRLGCRSITN